MSDHNPMYTQRVNWFASHSHFIPIGIASDQFDNVKAQVSDCLDKGWQRLAPITVEVAETLMFGRESKHRLRGYFMNKSCVFYATDLEYVFGICNYDGDWCIVRKLIMSLSDEEHTRLDDAQGDFS